jgi:hypothetical protein
MERDLDRRAGMAQKARIISLWHFSRLVRRWFPNPSAEAGMGRNESGVQFRRGVRGPSPIGTSPINSDRLRGKFDGAAQFASGFDSPCPTVALLPDRGFRPLTRFEVNTEVNQ